MKGNKAVIPEGSPWDWGELPAESVLRLSEMTKKEHGPAGLLFQYFAVRKIMSLRPGVEAGSGFDVLEAVAECARCGLVMPDWLARAFLSRYRAVSHDRAKSWDDPLSFGPPFPKGTNIEARRKARVKGVLLHSEVRKLMNHPHLKTFGDAIYEAGLKLGVGKTLAEEYFYTNEKRLKHMMKDSAADALLAFIPGSGETTSPAKTKKTAGRQKPTR